MDHAQHILWVAKARAITVFSVPSPWLYADWYLQSRVIRSRFLVEAKSSATSRAERSPVAAAWVFAAEYRSSGNTQSNASMSESRTPITRVICASATGGGGHFGPGTILVLCGPWSSRST